jgi:hypothetical protein
MHGIGFELPLQDWFDFKVPRTTIQPKYIQQIIEDQEYVPAKAECQNYLVGRISINPILFQKEKEPNLRNGGTYLYK